MTWLEHGFIQHCPARVPWRETGGAGATQPDHGFEDNMKHVKQDGHFDPNRFFLHVSLFMSPSVLKTETSNSGLLKWLLVCTSGNPVSSGLL